MTRPPSRIPRTALGVASLAAIAAATLIEAIPAVLGGWYGAVSLASYFAYLGDKTSAGRGKRRIPENTLHLLGLMGGWPGALIAQQQFHHKTAKQAFQWVFWLTVMANLAVVGWWLDSPPTR